jgi:glycosyltransferase involved in cell wall biosynthesis
MNRVAVLIPVFNNVDGLKKSLQSLNDSAENFDVVVVDDGSTPKLQFDVAEYRFKVVVLCLDKNEGIEGALNAGVRWIDFHGYEFIARLDAGDCVVPGRIEKQIAFMDAEPDCAVVGSWVEIVDANNKRLFELRHPTSHQGIVGKHRFNTALAHPSVMIRTKVLRDVGLYSSEYKAAEDFDLWLRIQEIAELRNIGECLVRKELSAASISARRRRRQTFSRMRLLSREFDWFDWKSYFGMLHCAASFLFSYSAVAYVRQKVSV